MTEKKTEKADGKATWDVIVLILDSPNIVSMQMSQADAKRVVDDWANHPPDQRVFRVGDVAALLAVRILGVVARESGPDRNEIIKEIMDKHTEQLKMVDEMRRRPRPGDEWKNDDDDDDDI